MRSRRALGVLQEAAVVAWTLVAAWIVVPGGLGASAASLGLLAAAAGLLVGVGRS
jgi:hypothetical protein